jgi:hypothetical protein
MIVASLVLSVVAVTLATLSLGWNIYSWHRAGARLKVTASSLMTYGPPMGQQTFIAIEVVNNGRLATQVQMVGFELPTGEILIAPQAAIPGVSLPHGLDPGASFVYPMSAEDLKGHVSRTGLTTQDIRPYATCGHGTFHGTFNAAGRKLVE